MNAIMHTLRFWVFLWGLRDNVWCSSWAHWKARRPSRLPIAVKWTFFARCYGWGATGENRFWKISVLKAGGSVCAKFSRRRGSGRPLPIISFRKLSKVIVWQTDTTKIIYHAASRVVRLY